MLRELDHEESMSGSEGHLLAHPDEVAATLTDGIRSPMGDHTLPERVGEDGPSVESSSSSRSETSSESSSESSSSSSMSSGSGDQETSGKEEEEDLPPLIRIKDEEGEEVRRESSSESLDLEPISSNSSEGEEEEDPSPLTYPLREMASRMAISRTRNHAKTRRGTPSVPNQAKRSKARNVYGIKEIKPDYATN
jgi:hypothetical protein